MIPDNSVRADGHKVGQNSVPVWLTITGLIPANATDQGLFEVLFGESNGMIGPQYVNLNTDEMLYDEDLATLSLILNKGDRQFQAKARYNLGNLHLEQAVQHAEALNMNEALPLWPV